MPCACSSAIRRAFSVRSLVRASSSAIGVMLGASIIHRIAFAIDNGRRCFQIAPERVWFAWSSYPLGSGGAAEEIRMLFPNFCYRIAWSDRGWFASLQI